jgi:hypothetical protein
MVDISPVQIKVLTAHRILERGRPVPQHRFRSKALGLLLTRADEMIE